MGHRGCPLCPAPAGPTTRPAPDTGLQPQPQPRRGRHGGLARVPGWLRKPLRKPECPGGLVDTPYPPRRLGPAPPPAEAIRSHAPRPRQPGPEAGGIWILAVRLLPCQLPELDRARLQCPDTLRGSSDRRAQASLTCAGPGRGGPVWPGKTRGGGLPLPTCLPGPPAAAKMVNRCARGASSPERVCLQQSTQNTRGRPGLGASHPHPLPPKQGETETGPRELGERAGAQSYGRRSGFVFFCF